MVVHSKSRTRKLIAITWLVPLVLASPYLYCRSFTFTIHSRYIRTRSLGDFIHRGGHSRLPVLPRNS